MIRAGLTILGVFAGTCLIGGALGIWGFFRFLRRFDD